MFEHQDLLSTSKAFKICQIEKLPYWLTQVIHLTKINIVEVAQKNYQSQFKNCMKSFGTSNLRRLYISRNFANKSIKPKTLIKSVDIYITFILSMMNYFCTVETYYLPLLNLEIINIFSPLIVLKHDTKSLAAVL